MNTSLPFDNHGVDADGDLPEVFTKKNLSQVYIDDDGHIIAVFSDDTTVDVTELFDVIKQR